MRRKNVLDRATAPSWLYRSAIAVVLLPFGVSAVVVLLHGPGAFIRDQALMELRVRDVGQHPVLLGLYSRDGWSHPGPLIYYTLALPYRLTGGNPSGLLVGALAVNAAAIAGMATIAKRLGGIPAALLTLLGAAIIAGALGSPVLFDPWVCFVTVLPFGLFCYLAWAIAERDAWALPAAVALASWLSQTHVGYAPLTAPALGIGALWLWIAVRRADDAEGTKHVLGAFAISAVVLVVLWSPTMWDQLFGSGNLGTLVDWFASDEDAAHTIAEGGRIVLGQFALSPDWVTGARRDGLFGETTLRTTTLWPVLLVPFTIAAGLAWRRRDRDVLRLALVTVLMVVVAIVAVSRTRGIMYEYRLLWTWVLGLLGAIVIAWTGWKLLAAKWPRAEVQLLAPVAIITIATLSVINTVSAVQNDSPEIYSAAAARVTRGLVTKLDPRGDELLLRSESHLGEWYVQGLVLGLERAGFDARVAADSTERFGQHRVADAGRHQARLVVLADNDLDGFVNRPNLVLVAYSGPVPLTRRAEIGSRVNTKLEALLRATSSGRLTTKAYLRAVAALKKPGPAVAVFREQDPP